MRKLLYTLFISGLLLSQVFGASTLPSVAEMPNRSAYHSFEEARGAHLTTDADFDPYIDREIVGADRQLAIHFLKLMPEHMRGDFIYIGPGNRLFSNHIALLSHMIFKPRMVKPVRREQMRLGARYIKQPESRKRLAYPPTSFPGGSGIREYSYQGINAALGYATPPCDVTLQGSAPSGDAGFMYFNAYDPTAVGSVVDAGLEANGTNSIPKSSVVPFLNPDPGSGWTDENYNYPCGAPVGIMYGTLPPNPPYNPMSMIATGIPDYDPTQMQLPPGSANWSHAAWNFFNTNSALMQGAGTYQGIPSNCTGCSVARLVTIGQNTPSQNGSCYGACTFNTPDARWDQVVMGELISPCSQTQGSETCTIEYASSGNWVAGQNTSQDGEITSEYNDQSGLEGVNLNGTATDSSNTYSNGRFSASLPPSPTSTCAPDSQNYCSKVSAATYNNGSNCSFDSRTLYGTTTSYYVFHSSAPSELMEQASYVKKYSYNSEIENCSLSTQWIPNEPKVQYNDSNLP